MIERSGSVSEAIAGLYRGFMWAGFVVVVLCIFAWGMSVRIETVQEERLAKEQQMYPNETPVERAERRAMEAYENCLFHNARLVEKQEAWFQERAMTIGIQFCYDTYQERLQKIEG